MSRTDRRLIPLLAFALATTAPSRAQDPDPGVEERVRTVLAEHLNGDPTTAVKELEVLLAAKPDQAGPILAAIYRVLRQSGRNAEAAGVLRRLAKVDAKWREFAVTEGEKLRKLQPDLQVPTSPIPERLRELVYKMIEAGDGWEDAQKLLMRIGSPAVPAILEAFGNMDLWQQGVAMDTLAAIGDSQVQAWFVAAFEDGGDEVVRGMVLQRVDRYPPGRKILNAVVLAAARCDSESVRRSAIATFDGPVPEDLIPGVLEWARTVTNPLEADQALRTLLNCPGAREDVEQQIRRLLPIAELSSSIGLWGNALKRTAGGYSSDIWPLELLTDEGPSVEQLAERVVALTSNFDNESSLIRALVAADPTGERRLREELWARLDAQWRQKLASESIRTAQQNGRETFVLEILQDPIAGAPYWRKAKLDLRRQSIEAARAFLQTNEFLLTGALSQILDDASVFEWKELAPELRPWLDSPEQSSREIVRRALMKFDPTMLLDHAIASGSIAEPPEALRFAEPRHLELAVRSYEEFVRARSSGSFGWAWSAITKYLDSGDEELQVRLARVATTDTARSYDEVGKIGSLLAKVATPASVSKIFAVDGLPIPVVAYLLNKTTKRDVAKLQEIARSPERINDELKELVEALDAIDPESATELVKHWIEEDARWAILTTRLEGPRDDLWKWILANHWTSDDVSNAALFAKAWNVEKVGERLLVQFTSEFWDDARSSLLEPFVESLEPEVARKACLEVVKRAIDRKSGDAAKVGSVQLTVAVEWLGDGDTEQVLKDLEPMLDPDLELSGPPIQRAMSAVTQTFDPRAVPLLTEMLRSPNDSVRKHAEACLERIATYYEAQNTWAERFKKLGIDKTGKPVPNKPSTPGPAGPSGPKRTGR